MCEAAKVRGHLSSDDLPHRKHARVLTTVWVLSMAPEVWLTRPPNKYELANFWKGDSVHPWRMI